MCYKLDRINVIKHSLCSSLFLLLAQLDEMRTKDGKRDGRSEFRSRTQESRGKTPVLVMYDIVVYKRGNRNTSGGGGGE